jgi:hypothetical protein
VDQHQAFEPAGLEAVAHPNRHGRQSAAAAGG